MIGLVSSDAAGSRFVFLTVTHTLAGTPGLIAPYGGTIINLVAPPQESKALTEYGNSLPALRLSEWSNCDLELLACGGFSPVRGFLGSKDYQSVLDNMRLVEGHVFPIPVTLPVDADSGVKEGRPIGLRDQRNNLLAVMDVEEVYEWDRSKFNRKVLGTEDPAHPTVACSAAWGKLNVSGSLRVVRTPEHYDFPHLRMSPAQVRSRLLELNAGNVVAFQTRNPLHRAHEELAKRAIEKVGGVLLLHPVAGLAKPGDVDHFIRVRTYLELTRKYFDPGKVLLSLLPLAMRFAGPREALWHALIRRNFGANHLIIGRNHASPGADSKGRPFYGPYDAQDLVDQFYAELGVKAIPFKEFVYVPDEERYCEIEEVAAGKKFFTLSGSEVRNDYINKGELLPEWFTRAEVAAILKDSYVPKHRRGICIWFTGLSGSGKSTTAEILTAMLTANERAVTLLDGDIVRTHLSVGLGFDRGGREANLRRIGFVASEIVRHDGVAVCAAVSPYIATRAEVRRMVNGNFVEVFVNTPLETCEQRDTKGMYAKARKGEIDNFTGISDAYEPPDTCEITIETENKTAEENARLIIDYLMDNGFLAHDGEPTMTRERFQ